MDIGQRIRKKREELNMTQDELAKKLGYASRSSVNKVENSREVSMKKINSYAKALDTSVSYLMGWEDIDNGIIIEISERKSKLEELSPLIREYALKMSKLTEKDQDYIMNMIDRLGEG